jgi:hypothetical protein
MKSVYLPVDLWSLYGNGGENQLEEVAGLARFLEGIVGVIRVG